MSRQVQRWMTGGAMMVVCVLGFAVGLTVDVLSWVNDWLKELFEDLKHECDRF